MGAFSGGSAYAMANQICEGYATINAVAVKRFSDQELGTLKLEIEKVLISLRAEVVPEGELEKIKARNRKVTRLSQATLVIQNHIQRRNR